MTIAVKVAFSCNKNQSKHLSNVDVVCKCFHFDDLNFLGMVESKVSVNADLRALTLPENKALDPSILKKNQAVPSEKGA